MTMTLARDLTRTKSATAYHACLYCGSRQQEPLYRGIRDRLGYVDGRWKILRCCQCGSGILHPFPSERDLAGFYPPLYSFTPEVGDKSALMKTLAGLERRLFFEPQYGGQVRQVLKGVHWQGQEGLRLLDVGCGRGLRLAIFRRFGFEVHGTDFLPEVVDYVKEQLGIPAVCADADGLLTAFPPRSFDVLTAFFVFEHVPDVDKVLQNCWTLLRPGGWLAAAVPVLDGLQSQLLGKRWINVTEAPRHLSLPSYRGLEIACRRAGFQFH